MNMRLAGVVATAVLLLGSNAVVWAQLRLPGAVVVHDSGQPVWPVYEGYWVEEDGTAYAAFGYLNKNHKEEVGVQVGPDNMFSPGPADQGQPTHFLPRRHTGVFAFALPAGISDTIVWTLNVAGNVARIPINLDVEYLITPFRKDTGGGVENTPPSVRLSEEGDWGSGPTGVTWETTATVGEPLALHVWMTDDGVGSRHRLSATWSSFRGPGEVRFAETSPEVADGRASTSVSFDTPGEHTLYMMASDGSRQGFQCCWTNGYVQVDVTR
ncbi:MAG TPA: hypothetical protein EYQ83_02840 [Acidobacteria bacterium]|nr:hypothetical protein [Acidobacteriota bacterium]